VGGGDRLATDTAGRRRRAPSFLRDHRADRVAQRQVEHLEATHGVEIVGWSARLADRAGLATDLRNADGYEVLLTELKAAAVDVACEHAVSHGIDVVFVDNRAVVVDGDAELGDLLARVQDLAIGRAGDRTAAGDR
jgi:cyclic 2,3-diphosphoglycerate synthetase